MGLEGKARVSRFEARQDIDYVYVIHAQLDRIMQLRNEVVAPTGYGHAAIPAIYYINAVESLYALLLPELRQGAKEYIDLASKVAWLERRIREASEREKKKELEEELRNILPEDIREKMDFRRAWVVGQIAAWIADKALEIMLRNLRKAGLLIRGREVGLGV